MIRYLYEPGFPIEKKTDLFFWKDLIVAADFLDIPSLSASAYIHLWSALEGAWENPDSQFMPLIYQLWETDTEDAEADVDDTESDADDAESDSDVGILVRNLVAIFVGRYLPCIMTHPHPQLASSMIEAIAALPEFKKNVAHLASRQVDLLRRIGAFECPKCHDQWYADPILIDHSFRAKGGEQEECPHCRESFTWEEWSCATIHNGKDGLR